MDVSFRNTDTVFLQNIHFDAVVGPDAWHRPTKAQPVSIDLQLAPLDSLEAAASEDNVSLTIDYGKLYKALMATLANQSFESVHHLYQVIRSSLPLVRSWHLQISLPKSILLADGGLVMTWESTMGDDGVQIVLQSMVLKGISCKCIVGVNPHERIEKQGLSIDVAISGIENRLSPSMMAGVNLESPAVPIYQDIVKKVVERVESSNYQTIEALATAVAQIVTMTFNFENARVTIEKPSAITTIKAAGVSIGRSKAFFENKDFWKVKRP